MNQQWQEFLQANNAHIENEQVKDFGLALADEQQHFNDMVLADLSHYALFTASGEDVETFLQGQLSNDIKQVTETGSQLSAYCNPKGRALALFRIFRRDGQITLRLPAEISEKTIKRLSMFILRSKVSITAASDLVSIGIAGKQAPQHLAQQFTNLPAEADSVINENGITLLRLPGDIPQYEACGEADRMIQLWQQLQPHAARIGRNSWDLLAIRSGTPDIFAGTVEAFVPQMLNLQAVNGLSFTKGCYPGQEVVARMQYLGKLKRRLYIAEAETRHLPQPGDAIFSGDDNEQKTGQVVQASWIGDNKVAFLAVLQIEKAENAPLFTAEPDKAPVSLQKLPYTLEK